MSYEPRATVNRTRDLHNVTRFMVECCQVVAPRRAGPVIFCDELHDVYGRWVKTTRIGPFLGQRTFVNLVRDVIRGTDICYGVVRRVERDIAADTTERHPSKPPIPDTTITRRRPGTGATTITGTDTTSVPTGDVVTDTVRTTRVTTTIRRGFSGMTASHYNTERMP